ncbi:hypothetical protein F5Y16DRAFT_343851 [Xylariaceae sp. FL0255]|nr:hypothetical protein F5Y16DRAFT_343851 [Xylariaceae sp. FL0255]
MARSPIQKLSRSPIRAFIVLLLLFITYQLLSFSDDPTSSSSPPKTSDVASSSPAEVDACEGLEGLDEVFVALRTGVTEAPKKLPAHFTTMLRCVPHFKLYSDYAEVIEGHTVHDVLADVNPDIISTHPDFEYYTKLQSAGGRGAFTAEEMGAWAAAKNTMSGHDSPGWRLDKWKFLPMAAKALAAAPARVKWFVFAESDTYILWKAWLAWLERFDASEPWYMGQQMQIGDVVFAYGGAGFAVSRPALEKVIAHREKNLKSYDDFTANHWAGDCVLGKALFDVGVGLHWSFPTLVNEDPAGLDFDSNFSGEQRKPWCYYAASFHHMTPADVHDFYEFEQNWYRSNTTLMRHKDIFWNYVFPRMASQVSDWDNHCEDEQPNETTFKACRAACEADAKCMQFSVTGYVCKTSSVLHLGREASAAKQVTSGWMMDRIGAYVDRLEAPCAAGDRDFT